MREVFNFIYAKLVAFMDEKQREEFDEDLYAPLEGWDKAEREFFEALARMAEE